MSNTYTPLLQYLQQAGKAPSMANLKEEAIKAGFVDYSGSDDDNRQLATLLTPQSQSQGGSSGPTFETQIRDERGEGPLEYTPIEKSTNTQEDGEIAESMNLGGYKATEEKKLSPQESSGYASRFGLGGTNYEKAFIGLTEFQAQQEAQKIQNKLKGEVSARTSYSFDPATISGAKSAVDNFKFKLKDTMADSWNSPGTQQEKVAGLFEMTANDLSKLFTSQEDFLNKYQNNADLKMTIDDFISQGGKMDSITSRIAAPGNEVISNSRRDAVLGLMDQGIEDAAQILDYVNKDNNGNVTGDFTLEEIQSYMNGGNNQDTASYLASLGQKATPEAIQAYESLIPEKEVAQKEIARLAGIPQNQMSLYFGTPEAIGIYQQQRIQAEEKVKLLKKKELDEATDLRTKADLAVSLAQSEYDADIATIEENRLTAKNYMTAKLAKLGGLKTTGAAVTAIQKLDSLYEGKKASRKSKFEYDQKKSSSELRDKINTIENSTEEKIQDIQSDLSKDGSTILKEIFNLQKQSDQQIFTITNNYTTKLRTQIDKYTKEAESDSERYTKDYLSLAGKGFSPSAIKSILAGNIEGVVLPKKPAKTTTSSGAYTPTQSREIQQAGLGANTSSVKDFFLNTEPAFRDAWTRNYANGQNKNPTIQNITNSYNEWKTFNATKPKTTTTKTTTPGSTTKKATINDL